MEAGVPVKLDLYEGMIHNFQDRIPDTPESILARSKMRDFLFQHLGMSEAGPARFSAA
jgi:epsilon-lactone hydrolase